MATREKIQALLDEWTVNIEAVEFSQEIDLTTRTFLALAGCPPISDAFKLVASRAGLASENPDWRKLRESAIVSLTALLKGFDERQTRRAAKTMTMKPRSIYGR